MISKLKENFVDAVSLEGGFTLIELMIVIAIIGILAAVAIPQLTGVRGDANVASVKSEMKSVQNAMEMYFVENNEYPNDSDYETALDKLVADNQIGSTGVKDSEDNYYGSDSDGNQHGTTDLSSKNSYTIVHEVPGTSGPTEVRIDQTGALIVTD